MLLIMLCAGFLMLVCLHMQGIHLDPSIYLLDEECSGNAGQRTSSAGLAAESTQLTDPLAEHNEGLRIADQDSTFLKTAVLPRSTDKNESDKAACPVCEDNSEISGGSSITSRLKDMNDSDHCSNTGFIILSQFESFVQDVSSEIAPNYSIETCV